MTAIQASLAARPHNSEPLSSSPSTGSSPASNSAVVMARPSTTGGGETGGEGRGPIHLQRHPTQVALETCSVQSVRNSVLAGYAAGISGTLVGHPFDSLKVWMQTRDQHPQHHHHHHHPANHSSPPSSSSSSAGPVAHGSTVRLSSSPTSPSPSAANAPAGSTHASAQHTSRLLSGAAALIDHTASNPSSLRSFPPHNAGFLSATARRMRALYSGITGPLLSVGLIQSVNFGIYDSTRRILYGLQHPESSHSCGMEYLHHDSLLNVCTASFVAGSFVCVLTSPLVITKVKQQTSPHLPFRQALRETLTSPRTMFVGFPLHATSETLGRVVYYATYESLKRWLVQRKLDRHPDHDFEHPRPVHPLHPTRMANDPLQSTSRGDSSSSRSAIGVGKQPITLVERMGCAAASGTLCWSVIFPIDAVRSRLFAQSSEALLSGQSATVRGMARSIYEQGGYLAFFRGFSVTVLRAGPVAATVLPIYDMTLEYLSGLS